MTDQQLPFDRLAALLSAVGRPEAMTESLQRRVASLRRTFNAAACSLALLVDDASVLEFVCADGRGADAIRGVRLPADSGVAGWVASTGQAIVASDVSRDPRFAREVAEATKYIPETVLAAPVSVAGSVLGVVEVLDSAAGWGSGVEVAVLTEIAAGLGELVQTGRALGALEVGVEADTELAQLAKSFGAVAGRGPEEARLAQALLDAVATFLESQWR